MKTRILLLAALCICACQKAEPSSEPSTPDSPSAPASVFTASIGTPLSKTALADDGAGSYDIVWSAGDRIYVNDALLTIQADAQPSGYGPGFTCANFAGTSDPWPSSSPKYRALYPAALHVDYLTKALPAEQTYCAGNIAGFPMFADSDTKSFVFKNLCGIIALNLKGDGISVSTITLSDVSASPKPLSGNFTIVNDAAVISSGTNGVGLVCPTPVQLNQSNFTSFNIAVPEGEYEKLKIVILASDGSSCALTSKKAIVVERSKITDINISSPTFKNESAIITYVNTGSSKINKYAAGADASVFGDGLKVLSHEYNSSTKTGVITLSGTVTKLGTSAFQSCNLKSLTIPETVTSLGTSALASNASLSSMNFPQGLTVIGDKAFQGSGALLPDLSHVTSIGASAFDGNKAFAGAVTIPAQVESIGDNAFQQCDKITSITFEHTPASIGSNVMYHCDLLASATFQEDIALPAGFFNTCTSLNSVTFNGSVSSIGDNAFYKCAFTSFDVPAGVTSIGGSAFSSCKSLTRVTIPNSVEVIGDYAFNSCILLSDIALPQNANYKKIQKNCFEGCTALTSISIPSSVTNVGAAAFKNSGLTSMPQGWGNVASAGYGTQVFYGCPITSITFPDSWTVIPSQFCQGMGSLQEVDFGSGVTTTGSQMFDCCWSLTDPSKCVIPANITKLTDYTFYKCGLRAIPEGANRAGLTIGFRCFSGSRIETADISNWTEMGNECFNGCESLTTVVLGSGLTALPGNAFIGDAALSSIDLSHVQSFGSQALQGCTSLTSANLSAAKTLSSSVFKNCTSLQTVDFGSSLTSLGADVFSGDTAMQSITIRAGSVASLGGSLGGSDFVIYVPSELIESYKGATKWSTYSSRFQAIQ